MTERTPLTRTFTTGILETIHMANASPTTVWLLRPGSCITSSALRILVDNYQPDLLYCDGDIFFEEYGLAVVANLYNVSAQRHGGRL